MSWERRCRDQLLHEEPPQWLKMGDTIPLSLPSSLKIRIKACCVAQDISDPGWVGLCAMGWLVVGPLPGQ